MNKEKKALLDARSIGLAVVFLIFVGILLMFTSTTAERSVGFDNEEIRAIDGECVIRVGNREVISMLPTDVDAEEGELVTITTTLREDGQDSHFLAFYGRQSEVKMYLDGELVMASDDGSSLPFDMTPGSYWHFLRLPKDFDGMELRIEKVAKFERYAKEIPQIYIGTKAAFLYMVAKQALFSLGIGIPIVFLGVVMMFISLFLKSREMAKRIFRLGLFSVVTSIWSLLEARVTQMFFDDIHLASYILFSFLFLIPVTFTAYLLTYPSIAKKPYIRALFWCSLTTYIVAQVLQLTNTWYYIEFVTVFHVLVGLIVVGLLFGSISLKKEAEEVRKRDGAVYKAFWIFAVFVIIDIMQYYIFPTAKVGDYCKTGLLLFIIYLGYEAIKQSGEQQILEERQRVYKELAYKDGMTGLANRYAFDEEIIKLRDGEIQKKPLIMVADMNYLKTVNDKYGHTKGDEAIAKIGKLLKKHFSENAACYRIGGDEFCVIAYPDSVEEFEEKHNVFLAEVEKEAEVSEYPIEIATGYAMSDADVDSLFKEADEKMYAKKKRMKQ